MKRSGSVFKVYAADMAVQKHRLETFEGASIASSSTTATKARGGAASARSKSAKSSANSSSSSLLVKWPHPIIGDDGQGASGDDDEDGTSPSRFPQPIHWATLGFFFSPTAEEPDRVVSFLDGVAISGFRSGDAAEDRLTEVQPDNPFLRMTESRAYAKDQGYASPNKKAASSKGKKSKQTTTTWTFPPVLLPTGSAQVQARKKTFGNLWPHDKKLGSNCTSDKLAEAGFYFDPTFSEPDGATCRLCSRALDGWSSDDDPIEEHRRKNADCPFFNCEEQTATGKEEQESAAPGASVTASTSERSTASKATKSRQVSASTSRTVSTAAEASVVDLTEDVSEVPRKRTNRARPAKGKTKTAKGDTTTVEHDDASTTVAVTKKATRGKAKKGKQVESVVVPDDSEVEAAEEHNSRPATPEPAAVTETAPAPGPPQLSPRKTRSASRTKITNPIASISMAVLDDARDVPDKATSKASASRSKKGKKVADEKASSSRVGSKQGTKVEDVRDEEKEEEEQAMSTAEGDEVHDDANDDVASNIDADDAPSELPKQEDEETDAASEQVDMGENDRDASIAPPSPPPTPPKTKSTSRGKAAKSDTTKAEPQPSTEEPNPPSSPSSTAQTRDQLGLGLAPPMREADGVPSSSTGRVFSPLPKRGNQQHPSDTINSAQEDSFHSMANDTPLLPPVVQFTPRSILDPMTSLPPISAHELEGSVQDWLQGQIERALTEMRRKGEERIALIDERNRVQRARMESVLRGEDVAGV